MFLLSAPNVIPWGFGLGKKVSVFTNSSFSLRSRLEKLEEHAIITELSKVVYERALLHDRGSWIAVLEPLFCRRCYSMDSLILLLPFLFLYFLS